MASEAVKELRAEKAKRRAESNMVCKEAEDQRRTAANFLVGAYICETIENAAEEIANAIYRSG